LLLAGCTEHATKPERNRQWWSAKLRRNQERDTDTRIGWSQQGWTTIWVWEHEEPVRSGVLEFREMTADDSSAVEVDAPPERKG